MKKALLTVLILIFAVALAGCSCEHAWAEADCVMPKTCVKCNETEGAPLGHVWTAATCDTAKTCEVCAATEGEAKGHSWADATCTEAKHCTQCALVEGEIPGHKWLDATTEAPQTCEVCQLTEGERIITDPRFTTAAASELIGKWSYNLAMTAADLGYSDLDIAMDVSLIMEFGNSGVFKLYPAILDEAKARDFLLQITLEETYAEYAAQGISREAADAAVVAAMGITLEELCKTMVDQISITDLLNSYFADFNTEFVYYVEDDTLYVADSWDDVFTSEVYALDGDKLTIYSLIADAGLTSPFVRLTE